MPVAGNLPSPLRIRETSTAARQHSTRTKWIPQWHVLFGSDLPFQEFTSTTVDGGSRALGFRFKASGF